MEYIAKAIRDVITILTEQGGGSAVITIKVVLFGIFGGAGWRIVHVIVKGKKNKSGNIEYAGHHIVEGRDIVPN